jgi:hypothetical protein
LEIGTWGKNYELGANTGYAKPALRPAYLGNAISHRIPLLDMGTPRSMINFPQLALSVRQPWAWAIIHAGKDIENRDWRKPNPGLNFRGRVALHASKGMTQEEYREANAFIGIASNSHAHSPMANELHYGGIIGTVEIVDMVKESKSPWFFGRIGLVLRDPQPCAFIPCNGALGFFNWQNQGEPRPHVMPKWMLPKEIKPAPHPQPEARLL